MPKKIEKTYETPKYFYKELRLKEKAANERMRQLEKQEIESPAYQSIQAKLEILGRQAKGARGRRFSETGRATYNEMEQLSKILDEFLGQKTSTLKGAKTYYEDVWTEANKNNKLKSAGITKNDWFEFFENYGDKEKGRMYYSQSIKMFKAYMRKNKNLKPEDRLSPKEIAEAIQHSKDFKTAYSEKLGLTLKEVNAETQVNKKAKK